MGINQFGEIVATQPKSTLLGAARIDVYQFAYSGQGMDKSSRNAERFEKYSNREFELFKQVYRFAYSGRGMDKSRGNAEEFALRWMHSYYEKDFEHFTELYTYAYSGRGLDMSRSRAQEYALREVGKD